MSVTGAIVAGVGAAGAIGGAAISANAAGNAASTQANAADQAAQLQYQAEQQSLAFQKQVWQQQQQNLAPWLQSGAGAMSTMDQLMGLNAPNIPANYGQPQTSTPPSSGGPAGNYVPMGGGASFNLGNSPGRMTTAGGENGPPISSPYSASGATPVQGTMVRATGNMRPEGFTPGGVSSAGGHGGPPMSGPITVSGGKPVAQAPGIATGQLQPFAPWTNTFTAPTAEQARETPGYQFQLDQGTKAVQNSAAARGDLLSGNTLADLTQFGQGLADTTYNDTYNRALQQYQQGYNIYENNQANQWNRLAAMAGMGQTSVNQLNSAGSTAAGQYGSTVMGAATNIGNYGLNAGNATASGYINQANAINGGLGSLTNMGSMIPYLQMMNQGGLNLDSSWLNVPSTYNPVPS